MLKIIFLIVLCLHQKGEECFVLAAVSCETAMVLLVFSGSVEKKFTFWEKGRWRKCKQDKLLKSLFTKKDKNFFK